MKKINIAVIISAILFGCSQGDQKTGSNCKCAIPESVDKKTERGQGNSDKTWGIGTRGDVEAVVKKAVDAKISISGSYSNSNTKIEEVYTEIIGSNPQITQKANLFRSIACAYYEIVCQDNSLNEKEKADKLREVIAGYESNIYKIISDERTIKPRDKSNESSRQSSIITTPASTSSENQGVNTSLVPINENKKMQTKDEELITPKKKLYLAKRTIDNVEMKIIEFSQEGDIATIEFVLENKDASKTTRDFPIYPEYQQLIDGNSNSFRSQRCKVGNLDYSTGNLPVKLVFGNRTNGLVEFNVGGNTISKISYLKIGLGIIYFEFTNVAIN
ncbi:MAG: hypothetical protein WA004_01680 [Saprospiraceae bacterium]